MSPRVYIDATGRWSGGGRAFLANAEEAARRHPVLAGVPGDGSIPLIPRNVPSSQNRRARTFILAPQNAWPWTPVAAGPAEWARVAALRVASEAYLRRASAVLRISGAIPSRLPASLTSPVIHNVLDAGFDEAAALARGEESPWPGAIVSIGSGHSYRNIPTLIGAFRAYRASGGTARLVVTGPPGSGRARDDALRIASDLPDVTITFDPMPRHKVLATMREAAAVVLPSRVEASPFLTLEALAMTPRVVVSDIAGNREIVANYAQSDSSEGLFVNPLGVDDLAAAMLAAESGGAGGQWHHVLADPQARRDARLRWGERLASWIEGLDLANRGS